MLKKFLALTTLFLLSFVVSCALSPEATTTVETTQTTETVTTTDTSTSNQTTTQPPVTETTTTTTEETGTTGTFYTGPETRIYFYNTDNYPEVMAYAWVDGSGDELFGAWPGTAAHQEDVTNWWFIDVEVDTDTTPIYIIFNDHDENDMSTPDVLIDDATDVYVTPDGSTYPDKASAESATAVTTTLWFYNSDGWADVYAYAWLDNSTELIGAWPGTQATQDGSTDWWSIDVPVDTSVTDINIKFNNNNNGLETPDIVIDNNVNVYMTVDGVTHADKASAENSLLTTTTVWFYNSEGWQEIFAYAFLDGGTKLLGDWPGELVLQDGSSDWWYVEVTADPASTPFTIIFSGSLGSQTPQTQDILIDDSTDVYVTADSQTHPDKTTAESNLVTTTVWFYDSDGWADVYAYVWLDDGTKLLGEWSGLNATQDGTSDWWSIEVPVDTTTTNLNIIFNNNDDSETPGAAITDATNLYVTVDGSLFDSKTNAESSITP